MVAVKRSATALFCITGLTLITFVHCSLGMSPSLCDLKACTCQGGGIGKLVCDCRNTGIQEIILQRSNGQGRIPELVSSVTIQNCEYVNIKDTAFNDSSELTTINLQNIKNLDLDENSFNWNHPADEYRIHPGIKVNIIGTSIEEIPSYAFRGMIHSISIKNCTIDDLLVFSFASLLNTEHIDISDTIIDNIHPQAFKKFTLNSLILRNCQLPILPTRTMVDIEVLNEFRLENNYIDVIRTSAIKMHGMQIFRLIDNRINRLEKDSFRIESRGSIIFQNNLISDVMTDSIAEIKVDRRYFAEDGIQDFTFLNNSIESFEPNPFSINTTNFVARRISLNIMKRCSCAQVKKWSSGVLISLINTKKDGTVVREAPNDVSNLIYCKSNDDKRHFDLVTVKFFAKNECQEKNYKRYAVMVALVVFVLVACSIVAYCTCRNRLKRYINVPTNGGGDKSPYSKKTPIMIVPEGKTYRETELHVITEQAEPIVQTEYNNLSADNKYNI